MIDPCGLGNKMETLKETTSIIYLINKRFLSFVTRVRTYLGADVDNNHVPVVASVILKLRSVKKRSIFLRRSTDLTQKYAINMINRYENFE